MTDQPTALSPEPVLVLCFPRGSARRTGNRSVPAEGLLLGRDGGVFDDLLSDARVSPRHARIGVGPDGRLSVQDLGSVHGTWLNGRRLVGERVLATGDVLRLGDTFLVCSTDSAAVAGGSVDGLVGSGAVMVAVRRSVDRVAARSHTVVVTGETGTGKEVVARLLHERSGRRGPFIAVNCSTFADELLATELFGHAKGAFTGAVTEHTGLFRAARGGTLLLDELADMSMALQSCLLRALETRTVRPVGGTKDVEVDVRVIATSNVELAELVRAGRFRADLYARLAQWTIRTPALSARREDLPELTAHLLPRVDAAGRRLSPDLCEALLLHPWPLNVRGLMNILSIAAISADDGAPLSLGVEVADALERMRSLAAPAAAEPAPREPVALPVLVGPAFVPSHILDRGELEGLMVKFEGHVAAAARNLGMTRPRLYRMLGDHGLEPGDFRRRPRPAPKSARVALTA